MWLSACNVADFCHRLLLKQRIVQLQSHSQPHSPALSPHSSRRSAGGALQLGRCSPSLHNGSLRGSPIPHGHLVAAYQQQKLQVAAAVQHQVEQQTAAALEKLRLQKEAERKERYREKMAKLRRQSSGRSPRAGLCMFGLGHSMVETRLREWFKDYKPGEIHVSRRSAIVCCGFWYKCLIFF